MKYCTTCKAKYEDSVSFCPLDGEVLEDDPSSVVGTVLDGQYQIEKMLGKGGMGAVYQARHILLGDKVAIKILPPEVRTNAEWLRRFRREGQAARRFRHPNAVTVYDLRTSADGTVYMVMEFVEGHTLGEEMKRRGAVPPSQAFELLEPIMSVLNTAHAMGVVHRDLKPDNIMIGKSSTGEPVVKLLDLGIAKMREIAGADGGGTTALTIAGQVLGTPHYMSPEQWGELPRDGDSEIDGRADIYSLGLVFYEMIVGRRPYSGVTLHELRREHIAVVPPPLHETVAGVSRAFSEAITLATAKDRADRPATAGELAEKLRSALTAPPMYDLDRTVPDLPHFQESRAETSSVPAAQSTKSDVNAPTVITVDSSATAPILPSGAPGETPEVRPTSGGSVVPAERPRVESAPSPVPVPQRPSKPAEPVDSSSSITIPQTPATQPARRGPWVLIGVGALVLILAVVGVGGFFAFQWLGSNNEKASTGSTETRGTAATSEVRDLGRYWLEIMTSPLGESSSVAGVVPLASSQPFKFHFVLSEDGYLYILGPGERNQLTAFLTAKPAPISGVESNQVKKGADFSFPSGLEHWLELDKNPGTEVYTILFSPTPLSSPGFLTAQATGKPLSASEQAEFADFVAKYKANQAAIELNNGNANEPFVNVKVPKGASTNPSIFEIRIQHK
ncbi:MAG TPA: protein kinase [Pyrinomonadaceae bacterium]|nr:protein kinase [Pyrinomonadaceae bacterium]